jgi:hypothetical protein
MTAALPHPVHFADTDLPVRSDLLDAHRGAWERLATPGTWWTAAERIAIAAEVRRAPDCALCRSAREALSPFGVKGEHEAATKLPRAAVDAAHRTVTDPSRLTRSWVEELAAEGIDDAAYVELVGVVATVWSVDTLCRAIGAALHPLPSPIHGAPMRRRPEGLEDAGAFVPLLSHRTGRALRLWKGRRSANVIRALGLVPDEVRQLLDLSAAHYLPVEIVPRIGRAPGRALDRAQIELVAARVSAVNECFY